MTEPTTLFSGGIIVDGLGSDPVRGDVLVAGDRIVGVTDGSTRIAADREVRIDGLVIAPGFIDMHTHSDLQILCHPDHTSKLSQGVTTEVLGQDGLSYAPVDAATLPSFGPSSRAGTTTRRASTGTGGRSANILSGSTATPR